jgi:hypothetical protein
MTSTSSPKRQHVRQLRDADFLGRQSPDNEEEDEDEDSGYGKDDEGEDGENDDGYSE